MRWQDDLSTARRSRNRIVLVVVLLLVIENRKIEDEDEREDENVCRICALQLAQYSSPSSSLGGVTRSCTA